MHHQYASIVTGRDGPLCRKNPNYSALHIKMHIDISVLVAYRYSLLRHRETHGPCQGWGLLLASLGRTKWPRLEICASKNSFLRVVLKLKPLQRLEAASEVLHITLVTFSYDYCLKIAQFASKWLFLKSWGELKSYNYRTYGKPEHHALRSLPNKSI